MDLRVQRTIHSIEEAFVDLTLEKGFKKVSVTQIAKQAQINPKTFYDHFQDKYDLAQKLSNKIVANYEAIVQTHFDNPKSTLPENIKGLVTALIQNNQLRRAFIALNSFQSEEVNFNEHIKSTIERYLSQDQLSLDPLVINIFAAIVTQVIEYYMQNPTSFSIERQLSVINELKQIINSFPNQ